MPTVKDKTTGEIVSQQPYTPKGTQRASQIAESDPNWELSYAPNGKTDGAMRQEQMYAGGGKTGYNSIGMYEKGGKVSKGKFQRKSSKPTKEQTKAAETALKWKAETDKKYKEGKISHKDYMHKKRQMRRGLKKAGL